MFPAGRAGVGAFTSCTRGLLSGAPFPRAAANLHNCDLRANQVRQHQAEDQQQTRQPHVAHRVQQLYKATCCATTVSGARAVAGDGPRGVLHGAARHARPPPARQLSRPPAPRAPLIESLLFYERDARRDLFFYFPRGRPAPPAACDIRTIFHNFLYSRSLRRCVNLSIGAISAARLAGCLFSYYLKPSRVFDVFVRYRYNIHSV